MNDMKTRNNQYLSPVLGRYHEIEFKNGKGCYLYDTQDTPYLDFSSGIAVTSTGHCHPTVVKAIQDQAATLIHPCIGMGYYDPPLKLAQTLSELMGGGYQSFFTQSGSESNEAAIKLAKYVTKRPRLIAFKGGFHGRTLATISLTTSKEKYRKGYDPLLEGIDFFPYPYAYRCPWGSTVESECLTQALSALENSPLFTDQVAAVIVEPILGEGGYVPMPKPFMQALAKKCKEKGILLIVDEIQSGIARTGTWIYSQQLGIEPDIITLAKGLASGMPLGVCMAKTELMSQWSPGAHGGTYGSNPVTCAAANATLEVLKTQIQNIPDLGKKALSFLHEQLDQTDYVGDIRGTGLMIGIEIVTDKKSKTPDTEKMKQILNSCREKGLIVIACGIHDNVIRIIPPLIIDLKTLIDGLSLLVGVIHESN